MQQAEFATPPLTFSPKDLDWPAGKYFARYFHSIFSIIAQIVSLDLKAILRIFSWSCQELLI